MSLLGNLTVGILGNMSGLSGSLKESETTVQKFASNVDSLGKSITSVGADLSLLITGPLAAIGGTSVSAASDFESAFAGVRKTVDATEAELAVFRSGIRDMSQNMPQAATEIAGVAEAAGQLGIQNSAILGFTKTMVDMGVTTDMASDQAAMALARFATITKMPQDQFDRLGATIVGLGNNLAATESEIVEMGLRLAGAGNVVGMTEAQILGFSGALAAVGINAEAGGSAVSKLMIDMANEVATGGGKLEGFAKVAGMSAAQFQKSFKSDAASTIASFIEGLGAIDAAGGNVFATIDELGLSEIRLRDALLRSAGAGNVLRNALELGTKSWQDNTALTDEASQRYETFASKMQIFKNRMNDIAITLGDALMPALLSSVDAAQPFFDLIAGAANWFAGLGSGVQKVIISIAMLAAALGPVLLVLGPIVSSISTLIPLFSALVSPVGLIIAGVAALVAGLIYLYNTNETVRSGINAAWEWLQSTALVIFDQIAAVAMAAFDGIKSFWETWGEDILTFFTGVWDLWVSIFSAAFEILYSLVSTIFNLVKTFWQTWGEDILAFFRTSFDVLSAVFSAVFEGIWTFIKWVFGEIETFWNKWGETIVQAFKSYFEIVSLVWTAVFNAIFQTIKNIFEAIKDFWDRWGETITIYFQTVWNVIKDIFVGVWNQIKIAIETTIGVISNIIKLFLSVLKGDWQGAWDAIKGIVESVWNGIKNMFGNVSETMTNIGKDIIQGLINGISSMASAAWESAKDVAKGIGDGIKGFFGIHSPSRLMAGYGRNISEGLALGIQDQIGTVERAAEALSSAADVELGNTRIGAVESNRAVARNVLSGMNDSRQQEQTETIVKVPVYLDGKIITEVVSRVQASDADYAYRWGDGA